MSFSTRTLAYRLDSLVRVSRRDSKNHFGKIIIIPQVKYTLSGIAFFGAFGFILPVALVRTTQLTRDIFQHDRQFLPLPSQRFQIFSLSFQSPFHLSFTVLVRYRSPILIQLSKIHISVQGCSSKQPDSFGIPLTRQNATRDFHPLWRTFRRT